MPQLSGLCSHAREAHDNGRGYQLVDVLIEILQWIREDEGEFLPSEKAQNDDDNK
jgi:hypothetical protein